MKKLHSQWVAMLLTFTMIACPAMASPEDPEPVDGPDPLTLDELRTFSDVFNLIRKNHVDDEPEAELLRSAMRGMIASLDPHSAYLEAEAFENQENSTKGRYAGIGIEIDSSRKKLVVKRVIADGPAARADLQVGDMIIAIDQKNVKGRALKDSIAALVGEPGSSVSLKIRRNGEIIGPINLEREYIPVPSVHAELLAKDIALLQLKQFHLRSTRELQNALSELQDEAGGNINGIVLDLRDNPGGVISAAMNIADGFLEEGLVVYTRGRYPAAQLEYFAEPGEWIPGIPLTILVNGASASASEILAGALQDHGRATLVGQTTFGKGTVQSVLRLRNGDGLKLTTARYFTPAGRKIDKVGIEPDVEITGAARPRDGKPQSDPMIAKAIDLIRDGDAATGR